MSPDPRKVQALMAMPLPKCRKEFQSFLGILNSLSKFSPTTTKLFDPLWEVTSVKTKWSRNGMYQDPYDKVNYIIRQDAFKSSMINQSPYTWRLIPLVLAWVPAFYR